jgi:pyridoxamine 5'-phosphate oxidase
MSDNSFTSDPDSLSNSFPDEKSTDRDPFLQFSTWFMDAVDSGVSDPEAMFLATADGNGIPSGRIVLLKAFDLDGFVFFTNYNSRKGKEISSNPYVALVFLWKEIGRQVRITGKADKIPSIESDEYFSSRPMESRISAIISPQSSVIPGREYLEKKFDEAIKSLHGNEPERPQHWGGFRIKPVEFEFWQLRDHRLHDRIHYRRESENWIIERLAP